MWLTGEKERGVGGVLCLTICLVGLASVLPHPVSNRACIVWARVKSRVSSDLLGTLGPYSQSRQWGWRETTECLFEQPLWISHPKCEPGAPERMGLYLVKIIVKCEICWFELRQELALFTRCWVIFVQNMFLLDMRKNEGFFAHQRPAFSPPGFYTGFCQGFHRTYFLLTPLLSEFTKQFAKPQIFCF